MAVCGKKNLNATQFSMTDLDYVDGKHTVCAEGFDSANVDDKGKPIRIKHTDILVDPFQLSYLISDTKEIYVDEDDWGPMDEEQLGLPEDDLPCAKIKPRNVLWVCNLSPVAEDEDLYTIFSRFGTVTSAGIIRDGETGDSHCYGFIEFQDNEACELAYVNMDNALIDDRRIHVGFSQSVANSWRR